MIDPTAPSPFVLPPAPGELLLETERLLLRPLVEADLEAMTGYRGDPRQTGFVPFEPQSADEIRTRVGRLFGTTTLEGERAGLLLGAFRLSDGLLLGDLVIFGLQPEHGSAEIGWIMRSDVAGQGYATEAASAVLDAAFSIYGLRRVTARIDVLNTASARLAERLGMRLEATLVENEWFKGRWSSESDYAILSREWMDRRA